MVKASALLVIALLLTQISASAQQETPVDVEKLVSQQYAKLLAKMDEPQLSESGKANPETYRLILVGAFQNGGPMVVRVEISKDGSSEVYSKWLANTKKLKSKRYHLSPDQTARFSHAIDQSGFWDRKPEPPEGGFDGMYWTLEGSKNGKYHILEKWSPPQTDWMTQLGLQMLSIGHAPIRIWY